MNFVMPVELPAGNIHAHCVKQAKPKSKAARRSVLRPKWGLTLTQELPPRSLNPRHNKIRWRREKRNIPSPKCGAEKRQMFRSGTLSRPKPKQLLRTDSLGNFRPASGA